MVRSLGADFIPVTPLLIIFVGLKHADDKILSSIALSIPFKSTVNYQCLKPGQC